MKFAVKERIEHDYQERRFRKIFDHFEDYGDVKRQTPKWENFNDRVVQAWRISQLQKIP